MKWNINDAERRLELIDEHGDIKVIAKFINKEELQDRAYTLYAYAYVKSNQLFIKFGEAKKQSIYDRYHRGTATNANNQMMNNSMQSINQSRANSLIDDDDDDDIPNFLKNRRNF